MDAVVQVVPDGLMVTTYTTDPAGAVAGHVIVIDLDVDEVVAVAGATSSGTVVVVGGASVVVVATPDTPATRVFGAAVPWPIPFVAVTDTEYVVPSVSPVSTHEKVEAFVVQPGDDGVVVTW